MLVGLSQINIYNILHLSLIFLKKVDQFLNVQIFTSHHSKLLKKNVFYRIFMHINRKFVRVHKKNSVEKNDI